MATRMQVQGLSCTLNMPKQLRSNHVGGVEQSHRLPPYAPQKAYAVDEYPACPDNWMHGSDKASSYFVGVKEGHGMWLDFNGLFSHTHDVAVVLSIQGINPITGQKMVGKDALRLEKYSVKCPVHDVEFQQDRFCPECKFKWPAQNYLATTGTPLGLLWLDGFRTPDGKTRQYIITADEKKGVAAQLIGDERVFAIGAAFYLSKKKHGRDVSEDRRKYGPIGTNLIGMGKIQWDPPHPDANYVSLWDVRNAKYAKYLKRNPGEKPRSRQGRSSSSCSSGSQSTNNSQPMFFSPIFTVQNADWRGMHDQAASYVVQSADLSTLGANNGTPICASLAGQDFSVNEVSPFEEYTVGPITPVKQLEIGAGALIDQLVYDDPESIDYWKETPEGLIYINYCDPETLKKILDAGKRQEKANGFMAGLNVGA